MDREMSQIPSLLGYITQMDILFYEIKNVIIKYERYIIQPLRNTMDSHMVVVSRRRFETLYHV